MLTIVPAEPGDEHTIAELMEELDRFYGGTEFEPIEERVEQIRAMVFRDRPAANVLLAKDGERLVGFAAYSFLWPAIGLTQSLYLKELYVSEADRRRGIGQALIEKLIKVARETHCSRMEWTADADNPLALGFYQRLEYTEHGGKLLYRVGL